MRVASGTTKVDSGELHKLTIQISFIIAREFKWVDINFTEHGLLHYSVELIVLKGGWLIGTLSEKALESNNVCQAIPVRIFKEGFTCSAT